MTEQLPRRNSPLGQRCGRWLLRLFGWRIEGDLPHLARCVIAVAPHTSNWDFIFGVAAALALDLEAHWLGKHTLFRFPPAAWMFRRLGGVPVDRAHPHGILERLIDDLHSREGFLIGIAPEGTRRPVAHWKTGAWYLCHRTGAPLLPACIDYSRRAIVIHPPYHPGDDMVREMARLSGFYRAGQAKHPRNFLPYQADMTVPPPDAGGC